MTVASALLLKPAVEGQGLDAKGKPAIRPYTPISTPDTKGEMHFLIKAYPNGALTQYMHNELKPGMEMSFKGPLPKHRESESEAGRGEAKRSPLVFRAFPTLCLPALPLARVVLAELGDIRNADFPSCPVPINVCSFPSFVSARRDARVEGQRV